jgi:hypothetical protein
MIIVEGTRTRNCVSSFFLRLFNEKVYCATIMQMDVQLLEYIGQALIQGVPTYEIRQQLVNVGWDPKLVDEAMEKLAPSALSKTGMKPIKAANDNPMAQPMVVTKKMNPWPAITTSVIVMLVIGIGTTGALVAKNTFFVSKALPTPPPVDETAASQPYVQSYTNSELHFSLKVPADWSIKEFPKDQYGDGEQRFAFGLASILPSEFFNEGPYVWVKVFPVSNKNYSDFTFFKSQVGKGKTVKTTLGGNEAYDTSVAIYSERKGFVYELYLPTEKDSKDNSVYTNVSRQVWNSFRFTD